MPSTTAFFTQKQGELVPAPHARGPWSPDMLHGRLLGGLAARALEERHAEPGLHFARLTVDLFRNSPLLPVAVETTLVRDGRRIRVADAVISTDQGVIGRASAVLLRQSEQPGGEQSIVTPAWDAAPPEGEPVTSEGWKPPFDLWRLTEWGAPGPGRVWLRETYPLVDDEPVTPFVRAALAADFASPLSNVGTNGLGFINADYTLTLARLPEGELIGVEATGHLSAGGVATGQVTVHDTAGPFGFCAVTAVANPIALISR
ncbi:thioesterase family protein [Actinomadura sp. ATCC 31491]|uniref:Thioesterase family protein n=1 Tax=Actinomadura luzonensis TaxID=2805427 RepID=A0ABT0G3L2_9ACTN|nr:acyl-CoA thioesterase domain-containing protein [Actinomadura luzonensis]MCK2219191.1 thioesterase family protein [Actinomadura luzonensis]